MRIHSLDELGDLLSLQLEVAEHIAADTERYLESTKIFIVPGFAGFDDFRQSGAFSIMPVMRRADHIAQGGPIKEANGFWLDQWLSTVALYCQ